MRRGGCAVGVVVALLAGACTGDDGPDGDDAAPTETAALAVTASATDLPADEVVTLEVTGAPAGEEVELEVITTDHGGTAWSSTTRVDADDAGRAELDQPMEPFSTLAPDDGSADRLYVWDPRGSRFTVTARAEGREPASVEVRRRLLAEGVEPRPTTLAGDGVLGELWSPAPGTEVGSAVVLIGGSSGGLGAQRFDAAALASHGVTALQMAYFGAPGLPDRLTEIPLETFVAAIERLRREPGIDPERIWLVGTSRGSEAAVLVAARHPDLVAGVVLTVPGSIVACGLPDGGPAWSEGGTPIPCEPETPLPVTDVDGPVIATCGEGDRVWPSCAHADDLLARLADADRPPGDHLVSDPAAGHLAGLLTPYVWAMSPAQTGPLEMGGDPRADDRVRAEAWPLVLEALSAS